MPHTKKHKAIKGVASSVAKSVAKGVGNANAWANSTSQDVGTISKPKRFMKTVHPNNMGVIGSGGPVEAIEEYNQEEVKNRKLGGMIPSKAEIAKMGKIVRGTPRGY